MDYASPASVQDRRRPRVQAVHDYAQRSSTHTIPFHSLSRCQAALRLDPYEDPRSAQSKYLIIILFLFGIDNYSVCLKEAKGLFHCGLDVWTDLKQTAWLGVVIYLIWKGLYSRFTLDFIRWVTSGSFLHSLTLTCALVSRGDILEPHSQTLCSTASNDTTSRIAFSPSLETTPPTTTHSQIIWFCTWDQVAGSKEWHIGCAALRTSWIL
jgi:hypothetical protein